MDKAITTSLLIVISSLLALILFNAAYPAVTSGAESITNVANRAEDRMRSQIAIIHAAAERTSTGDWQDGNGNGDFEAFLWVKNIGDTPVVAVDRLDLFFGPEGNFFRIPLGGTGTDPRPNWTWQVENADRWIPSSTLRITVHYGGIPPAAGRYFVRVTLPNGITSDLTFGM